jgi:hypothetical protein
LLAVAAPCESVEDDSDLSRCGLGQHITSFMVFGFGFGFQRRFNRSYRRANLAAFIKAAKPRPYTLSEAVLIDSRFKLYKGFDPNGYVVHCVVSSR